MKIPARISKWIKNFLNNRKFYVAIDEEVSQEYPILTSVPQGSILSPILFLIFIYDMPLNIENYKNMQGLLFADDLKSMYCDRNLNQINIVLQKYLDNLDYRKIKKKAMNSTWVGPCDSPGTVAKRI